MAIELTRDIRGTGLVANYWRATSAFFEDPGPGGGDIVASATYRLWRDEAAYLGGLKPVARASESVRISPVVPSRTLAQVMGDLDAAVIAPGEALAGGTVV